VVAVLNDRSIDWQRPADVLATAQQWFTDLNDGAG
jgi:hypothetical protein